MVKKSARPTITWFGGAVGIPRACLNNDNTITILTKAVTLINNAGAMLMIYLPFLVIDFIVASILMSMGMMMIPPMFISLPFKLMLFVLADGFELLVKALVSSYK